MKKKANEQANDDIVAFHGQSFAYVLGKLNLLLSAKMSDALRGTGLHLGHVLILATLRGQRELHGESTLTQTRLTDVTGIEKSSLVIFLDALQKEGWIERQRHPTDRRAHIVHLTDEGGKRFETVGQMLYARQQESLAVLAPEEQAQMMVLMKRLSAHLST